MRKQCADGEWSTWKVYTFRTLCLTPSLISVTAGKRCGVGDVDLSAQYSHGIVKWYDAPTGGNLVHTGSTFSPYLTETTNYWVTSSEETIQTVGRITPNTTDSYTDTDTGLRFNILQPTLIQSVDVYSTSNGTINIKIVNSAGVEIFSTGSVSIVGGGSTSPNVIPIDYEISPGTDYKILIKSYSGVNLIRNSGIGGFPYEGSDGAMVITNGEFLGTSTSYYYFYNIKYGNPCRAPRTQVSGTVNPPPTLTLSSNTFTICQGESDVITITEGAENYDSYTWSPSAGVTGSATTEWTFNPTVHTNYTLTAHNSEDDCTKITTVNVTVSTAPIYTNLEGQYEVCPNEIVELNVNTILTNQFTVGTNNTLTSSTDPATAFYNRYAQSRQQYIYTTKQN